MSIPWQHLEALLALLNFEFVQALWAKPHFHQGAKIYKNYL